jgi:diguanylate cyclase (GGDEF)-like protein
MSRALMYLFVAGGGIALLTLAVPDKVHASTTQVLAMAGLAFAVALLLLAAGERLPLWGYHACLATGTVLIEWAIFASDNPTSLFAMFFLWIAVYAFYFFNTLEAALQVAFIVLTYAFGLTLIDNPGQDPFLSWLTTTVGVVVVGGMIGALKHRLDAVMSRLADANQADTVTGLQNETGFDETLDVELERARRSGTRVTVMIGSVDPQPNPAKNPEKVLELVGGIIGHEKRRVDAGARLGVDEFALVLPYTDAHGATVMAERLRTVIREAFTENEFDLTISFGISSFPRNGNTCEVLLQTAREALDSARELGSDRVVVHQIERPSLVQHIESIAVPVDDPPPIPAGARVPRAQ